MRKSTGRIEVASMLIKGATLVTMDRALGDLCGDVLVRDGLIEAVAPSLDVPGAQSVDASGMIVIPGLVNAHIHVWEFPLRGIGADWVSHRDYHGNVHGNLAMRFEAEDVYLANLIGALHQINTGTTTVLDWCHVLRDEEMADAALDGLEHAGIRALFARGTAKPPADAADKPYWAIPYPRAEIERLRSGRLAANDGLITLGMAILGPDIAQFDVCVQDYRLAKEYDLLASAHIWGRKGKRRNPEGLWELNRLGLLGPQQNIAHGNCLEDDEVKMVLDAGCSITATDFTEMLNSERVAMLGRVLKQGGFVSLGTDVCPYFNSSMLWELRHAFMHQRENDNRNLHARGAWPSEYHATRTRDALEWATLGGARAGGLVDELGSLEVGKRADLAVIDVTGPSWQPPAADPVLGLVWNQGGRYVDTTVASGRVVWSRRTT